MSAPVFLYCRCNISEVQPHVHCECEICNRKPVSRATAYRHFTRTTQITAQAVTDGGDLLQAGTPLCSSPNASLSENCAWPVEFESDACSLSDNENNEFEYTTEVDYGSENIPSESPMHVQSADGSQCLPHSQPESAEIASSAEEDSISDMIVEAVLDALKLQLELKLSRVGLEKILEWGKKLFMMAQPEMENVWPKDWSECEKVLKKVGYEDAKQYFISIDDSHRCLYGQMESSSQPCPHCGKQGTIPYYYIGLDSKLKLWCKDPEMCRKLTYHMKEKDH